MKIDQEIKEQELSLIKTLKGLYPTFSEESKRLTKEIIKIITT